MKRQYLYLILIIVIIVGTIIFIYCPSKPVTTIFLVRHAEKADVPGNDQPLSPAGEARALELAHVLEKAGIDAIFATTYQRTQQTVGPTAIAYNLIPHIIADLDNEQLVNVIRNDFEGQEVLVAGHSHTLAPIMQLLGISEPPALDGDEYDNLFIISVQFAYPQRTWVRHLQYGAFSP